MKHTGREYKILKKEFEKVEKSEFRIISRAKKRAAKGMDNNYLRNKIPQKTYDALEKAFEKAFKLIFEKGSGIIETTSGLEKIRCQSEKYEESMNLMIHEGTINAIDKLATTSGQNNKLIGTADGTILGVAGMGMPDIPIFLLILLKTCYSIGASYGFDYRKAEEKKFTMAILKTAFSVGEEQIKYCKECNDFINMTTGQNNLDAQYYEVTEEDIKDISNVLATSMLVAKFIQGFTLLGIVGGAFNYSLVNKLTAVAKIEYKKRFLAKHLHRITND